MVCWVVMECLQEEYSLVDNDRIFPHGMCLRGQLQNVSRRNMRKCVFMDNDRMVFGSNMV